MTISPFSFQIIDWNNVPEEERLDETGSATWQILHGNIHIRKLTYSANYKADH